MQSEDILHILNVFPFRWCLFILSSVGFLQLYLLYDVLSYFCRFMLFPFRVFYSIFIVLLYFHLHLCCFVWIYVMLIYVARRLFHFPPIFTHFLLPTTCPFHIPQPVSRWPSERLWEIQMMLNLLSIGQMV